MFAFLSAFLGTKSEAEDSHSPLSLHIIWSQLNVVPEVVVRWLHFVCAFACAY